MRTASELVPYFSRLLDDEPELPLDDELLEEEEDDEPLTASAILRSGAAYSKTAGGNTSFLNAG